MTILSSCQLFSRHTTEKEKEPVARVYNNYLYRADLPNFSEYGAGDSTIMANQFIENWIKQQLLVKKAKENVSIDIDKMVEEYRTSLLLQTYRNALINQKLNTDIEEEIMIQYYDTYKNDFPLEEDMFAIKYAFFYKNEIEEHIFSDLIKEETENKTLINAYVSEYGIDYNMNEGRWLNKNSLMQMEISSYNLFVTSTYRKKEMDDGKILFYKIYDQRSKNDPSPLPLIEKNIADIILYKRKRDLWDDIQEKTYTNAKNAADYEIY